MELFQIISLEDYLEIRKTLDLNRVKEIRVISYEGENVVKISYKNPTPTKNLKYENSVYRGFKYNSYKAF